MCGIAGYVRRAESSGVTEALVMLESIRPRGPDDEGASLIGRGERTHLAFRTSKTDPGAVPGAPHLHEGTSRLHDVALLHTRYSILDLSPAGHQPFENPSGSIVAVFNGEIYNFIELRQELQALGVPFRTASDTEVLVQGYACWREGLWARLNGFWAVALYDRETATFVLSRDRLGIAPLYYRETPQGLYFASQIRCLLAIKPAITAPDAEAVGRFISTGIKDDQSRTLYREIRSLAPGVSVSLPPGASRLDEGVEHRFWSLPAARLRESELSFDDAVRSMRELLFGAVELRLRSDVPVAFELSGGLDSSSIVAVAAHLRSNRITSFTIRVPEQNEEPFARAILERYPIDYRVLESPEDSFMHDADAFTRLMEEPYHSPNIYTHYQMRLRMKAEGVSVVLSGSGGDEVVAGYEHLFWRRAAEEMRRERRGWDVARYSAAQLLHSRHPGRRIATEVYWGTRARVIRALKSVRGRFVRSAPRQVPPRSADAYRDLGFHEQSLYHFRVALLPYYLRSNDHFTMAIPLEQRLPFLDYRIVELGLRVPAAYLFHAGWTKYLLRRAMEPYLPKRIVWRRTKMGFPFAYRPFLTAHRLRFESLLPILRRVGIGEEVWGDYDHLLERPRDLWRLVSTALWLEASER
jgi:asparagine synthase (glutamine-hydrolysing)